MPILACGMNHKTAPIHLREKAIFAQEKITLFLNDLIHQENIHEAVLLSTCNRSELYCVTNNISKMKDWFCRQHPLHREEIEPALYFYQDAAAIEHMMNVACGLDSMVLGETQILGQMKDAFSESCAAGSVGPLFNRLFQQIFAVAKEIRTNTAMGACPVSVSSAAANFVKRISPFPLEEATLLLIGAGTSIELVMRHLKDVSFKKKMIANRKWENASKLSEKYVADVVHLADLGKVLQEADIVVSATGGALPIVTRSMLMDRKKPIWIIDIAVPRDVESDVATCEQVHLYSIDDLKDVIQQNLQGREHVADKSREVIKQKSQEFMTWLTSFDLVAMTISAYRKQIEDLCRAELTKAKRQLTRGDDPVQVMASFAHALTNKLLHAPSVQLRQAGHEGRLDILQFAQQLFAIPEFKSQAT